MTYEAKTHPIIKIIENDMSNGRVIYNGLVRKAFFKTRNHHDAEDIASAVVLKAIEGSWRYKDPIDISNPAEDRRFMAWLRDVYHSCVLDHYRFTRATKRGMDRTVSYHALGEMPKEAIYEEANTGEGQELGELLREAISRLHPRYSTVATLVYLEGLSHEETSKMLRIPLGTVKSRTDRIKKLLTEELALESRVA